MYWSVFSVFHLVSNMVRDIVIWIPGFYSVMTLTVAFLLLPMTRGAETIFRKVLVPICQLEVC
jgi:receptor expression-enhancing protein 5/6